MALKGNTQFLNSENVKQLVDKIKDYNEVKDLELKASVIALAAEDAQQRVDEEEKRASGAEGNLELLSEAISNSEIYKSNKNLVGAINAEVFRAKGKEEEIASTASTNLNNFKNEVGFIKSELESSIANEEAARIVDTTSIRNVYDGRISTLDSTLKGYTDTQVNSKGSELTNYIDGKVSNLSAAITAEIQNRASEDTDIRNSIIDKERALYGEITDLSSSLNNRITTEINSLDNKIVNHNSQYATLNANVQSHIDNKINPHQVTTAQIGAATQESMDAIEDDIRDIKAEVSSNAAAIQTINNNSLPEIRSDIQELGSKVESNALNISNLKQDKLDKVAEEQSILGKLIIGKDGNSEGGNLVVQGDLIVNGATITQQQETIQVKDNFIVINSEGETIGANLAGIAIRTDSENAYGIAYDATNQTISLGVGNVELNGNGNSFSFKTGESNPILTRDISSKIEDGHLLSFDKNGNKAIDSGYSKDKFKEIDELLGAHQDSLDRISSNLEGLNSTTITNLKEKDNQLDNAITSNYNELINLIGSNKSELDNLIGSKDKLSTVAEKNNIVDTLEVLDERLDNIETNVSDLSNNKQNKEDSQLATTNKSIVPAINEIYNAFTTHEDKAGNPHNITWSKIYNPDNGGSPVFATTGTPIMDGVGTLGASTQVARHDHQHPTDTSRAPVNHSSASNMYGEATTVNYGHVRITDTVSEGNVDIANSGTVYTFVTDILNNKINSLDYSEIYLDDGETIKNISQTDGTIRVERQSISITQSQVQELPNKLTSIDTSIKKINKDVFGSEDGGSSEGDESSLSSRVAKNAEAISKENERALQAESKLQEDLSKEAATRKEADDSLGRSITSLSEEALALKNKQNKIDGFRDSYHTLISNLSDATLDSTYYTFKFEKKDGKYFPVFISSWDEGILTPPPAEELG